MCILGSLCFFLQMCWSSWFFFHLFSILYEVTCHCCAGCEAPSTSPCPICQNEAVRALWEHWDLSWFVKMCQNGREAAQVVLVSTTRFGCWTLLLLALVSTILHCLFSNSRKIRRLPAFLAISFANSFYYIYILDFSHLYHGCFNPLPVEVNSEPQVEMREMGHVTSLASHLTCLVSGVLGATQQPVCRGWTSTEQVQIRVALQRCGHTACRDCTLTEHLDTITIYNINIIIYSWFVILYICNIISHSYYYVIFILYILYF